MERNNRRVIRGKVVSTKMEKTIVIEITESKSHRLYGKQSTMTKKIKVRDEQGVAKVGDIVEAMETRPLSKDVHFRLTKVVEEAIIL